jgi:hypothetical protein
MESDLEEYNSGRFRQREIGQRSRENKKTPPLAARRNGGAGTEKRQSLLELL